MIDRKEDLLRKIRALMAKATGAGVTEEEAALFAAKAQELLSKYNIDEAEIAEKKPGVGHEWRKKTQWSIWRRALLNQVCLFYGVKLVQMNDDRYVLVGLDCNIEVSKSMHEYLVKACDRLAKEYILVPGNVPPGDAPGRIREDFKRGCSTRLCERLREMRKAQQTQPEQWHGTNPGNLPALMRQQSAENHSYLSTVLGIRLGKSTAKTMKTGQAAAEGYRRGDEIGLNTQVGARTSSRLMISNK